MSVTAQLRELQHASPQQLLERVQRGAPYGVSVLLVIAIAWQLVQLTWLLLAPSEGAVEATPNAPSAPRAQPIDVQRIARARLFGSAEAPAPSGDINAPQTQSNLRLTGTIASDDPAKGWAIIGDGGGAGKFYSTGDAVPGGARLHAVYTDRVILDRNGQLEALTLPRLSPNAVARMPPPPPPPQNQFAENLRRIAETNPGALAEVIRPQPVFAGGTQRGYRVYPGRNRQQFAQLGLRPGDLILSINGTPLDDPNRGAEIFSTLGSSGRVQVSIERNGQTQELTLNTAQINLPQAEAAEAMPAGSMEGRTPIVPPSN